MHRTRLASLGALTAIWLAACSVIVPGDTERIPCQLTPGGNDPCTTNGQQCNNGFCQDCLSEEESPFCDLIDNNCNGLIDEDIDSDDDGYLRCSDATSGEADCDDDDGSVFPHAEERCNARDDDCDGALDESTCAEGEVCRLAPTGASCVRQNCFERAPPACEAGRICDPETRECEIPPALPCGDGCPDGLVCDSALDACVRVNVPVGSDCDINEECSSGLCIPRSTLRLPLGGEASSFGVCGQACCGDSDCEPGRETCWVAGTGARSCLPRTLVNSHSFDASACGRESNCGSQACGFRTVPLRENESIATFVCVDDAPLEVVGCGEEHAACRSGICSETSEVSYCTRACGSSADCEDLQGLYVLFGVRVPFPFAEVGARCGYERVNKPGGRPVDWIQLCMPRDENAGVHGTECDLNNQCRDRFCDSQAGICRKTCCVDRDCASSEQCIPYNMGDHWEMHCGPRTEPRRLPN